MITFLLHILAKTFIVIWAISFFLFSIGTFIHYMLILASIFLVFRYIIISKSDENTPIKKYEQIL